MAKAVKKVPPKNARANRSGTLKPALGKKPSSASKRAPAARPSRPAHPTPAKPAADKPVSGKPTSGKPTSAKPVAAKPAAEKPPAGKPVAGKPATGKPADEKAAAKPKAAPPKPAPAPALPTAEAPKPPIQRPQPPAPPPVQPPATPKPNLIKISSLGPGAAARLTAARDLLDAERRHDLPGVLACFGSEPTLEFAGGPRHIGAERVGQIFGDLMRAFPDLVLDVVAEHVGDHSVVVELVMQGTHRQQWLGMAPRGRALTLPVCYVFLFDKRDRIAALRIYLDRNLAIVQLTSGLLR